MMKRTKMLETIEEVNEISSHESSPSFRQTTKRVTYKEESIDVLMQRYE